MSNSMMRWGVLAVVLGAVTVVWGSAFFGWRWTLKRLGLDTLGAPDMGQGEKSVRRSLRALLAFNFFVMWPVGLPVCVMLVVMIFEERDLIGPSVAGLLGFALFTVAVPSLIRTARQLERQRLSGESDAVAPSFWIEGRLAPLSPQNSAGSPLGEVRPHRRVGRGGHPQLEDDPCRHVLRRHRHRGLAWLDLDDPT